MKKITFVTTNRHKLAEARAILSEFEIDAVSLELPELQGGRHAIIKHKAREAAEKLKKDVFVEDVNLCIKALGGLPGPYIKEFVDNIRAEGIFKMLSAFKDKSASAIAMIAYCEPGREPAVFEGIVEGKIVKPRGKNGFGFDTAFLPNNSKKTFGEMSDDEKNTLSHRREALMMFKRYLENEA